MSEHDARTPASSSSPSPRELAARAAEVVARWEARLRNDIRARSSAARSKQPTPGGNAATQLRAELVGLEQELASVEAAIGNIQALSKAQELKAMTAIAAGDDLAARRALSDCIDHNEAAAALDADRTVLLQTIAACRIAIAD
jgi:hypothetical protein